MNYIRFATPFYNHRLYDERARALVEQAQKTDKDLTVEKLSSDPAFKELVGRLQGLYKSGIAAQLCIGLVLGIASRILSRYNLPFLTTSALFFGNGLYSLIKEKDVLKVSGLKVLTQSEVIERKKRESEAEFEEALGINSATERDQALLQLGYKAIDADDWYLMDRVFDKIEADDATEQLCLQLMVKEPKQAANKIKLACDDLEIKNRLYKALQEEAVKQGLVEVIVAAIQGRTDIKKLDEYENVIRSLLQVGREKEAFALAKQVTESQRDNLIKFAEKIRKFAFVEEMLKRYDQSRFAVENLELAQKRKALEEEMTKALSPVDEKEREAQVLSMIKKCCNEGMRGVVADHYFKELNKSLLARHEFHLLIKIHERAGEQGEQARNFYALKNKEYFVKCAVDHFCKLREFDKARNFVEAHSSDKEVHLNGIKTKESYAEI